MATSKQLIRHIINRSLEKAGFHLMRFNPETSKRAILSPWLRDWQVKAFRQEMEGVLASFPELSANLPPQKCIQSFLQRLAKCPVHQVAGSGGGGVTTAAALWCIAQAARPKGIIESGVFRGFTTWVLEDACPESKRICFDISFDELRWKSSTAKYYECDWAGIISLHRKVEGRWLAFFDDHISQAMRIQEAAERGIKYIVFDDCLPVQALHFDGQAAYPTVDMLFDKRLTDKISVEWITEAGRFQYIQDAKHCEQVRKLIKQWTRLPSGAGSLGYMPSHLALVEVDL
jgi:hypothetical protein